MSNCQDTVVNWLLLRNNFVTLHVRPVLIGAINPLKKRRGVHSHDILLIQILWLQNEVALIYC
jgi:hypothetical protein